MKKMSWFAALAALMCLGVAPVVGGCGDDDDDSSGDGDADSDADSDADGDGDGDCSSGNPLANSGCDWTCNDINAPDLRLSAASFSAPAPLANQLMASIVRDAIDDGTFVWLVDNQGGTNFSTGAGTCSDANLSECEFEGGEFPPSTGAMDYDSGTGEFRLPSGTDTMRVEAVIHSDTAGDVVLTLQEASLTGTITHNGNCVGSRTNDVTPSEWDHDGHISGKMTVTDASSARIDSGSLHMSLCDFMSGGLTDGYCTDHADPTSWPNAPDTAVNGDPAWQVEGDISAIGVHIN